MPDAASGCCVRPLARSCFRGQATRARGQRVPLRALWLAAGTTAGAIARARPSISSSATTFCSISTMRTPSRRRSPILTRLCRGVLYFTALTAADWRWNCDQRRTDSNVHLRAAAWYRARLQRGFREIGAGFWLRRGAPLTVWELESCTNPHMSAWQSLQFQGDVISRRGESPLGLILTGVTRDRPGEKMQLAFAANAPNDIEANLSDARIDRLDARRLPDREQLEAMDRVGSRASPSRCRRVILCSGAAANRSVAQARILARRSGRRLEQDRTPGSFQVALKEGERESATAHWQTEQRRPGSDTA